MKYKIDYISDIHCDFWLKENSNETKIKNFIEKNLKPKTNKILVISGDLSNSNQIAIKFLKEIKKYYTYVVFVFGNHDYYLDSNRVLKKHGNSYSKVKELKNFFYENWDKGMLFLDGNKIILEGLSFVGTCMWYDFKYDSINQNKTIQEVIFDWCKDSNDSCKIITGSQFEDFKYKTYKGYNVIEKPVKFNPFDFYNKEYKKLNKYTNEDIVVTHMPPVIPKNIIKYEKENSFSFFQGEDLIKKIKPKIWFHGHLHTKVEEKLEGTKILSNPFGYPVDKLSSEIKTVMVEK